MNFEALNHEQNQKTKSWETTLTWVNTLRDKLGRPVDKNIKEAVAGLKLFGISTTASCEGHLDHGTYAPYIDVETSELESLENRLRQADSREKAKEVFDEIKRKNLMERQKLIPLLEEFYAKRLVSFDSRLIINSLARYWSRLESQGAELQKIQPEEIKHQKLENYKKEMAEFTTFLKNKHFNKEY